CADEHVDGFFPVELQSSPEQTRSIKRFYRHAGAVPPRSKTQLLCSGCTQLYGNTPAARGLLRRWQRTISTFAGSADDQCLDFTYNNLTRRSWIWWMLKPHW